MRHIDDNAVAEAPFQRDLIDRFSRLAVHGRTIMPGGIDMSSGMNAHFLNGIVRPACKSFWKKTKGQPERPQQPTGLPVRLVPDLYLHEPGVVAIEADGFAQIDD